MLKQVTITLTADQLLSMGDTPVLAISAPPANSIINPNSISLKFTCNTTAYVVTGALWLLAQYGPTGPGGVDLMKLDGILMCGENISGISFVPCGPMSMPYDIRGLAMYLTWDGSLPTLGDGTLTVTVNYTIDPL